MSRPHVPSIVDACQSPSEMNAKLLIVEDEKTLARILCDRLQKEGYAVTVAHAGNSGIDAATHEEFGLLILDLMLPELNGLEICQRLRQLGSTMPIAYGTPTD